MKVEASQTDWSGLARFFTWFLLITLLSLGVALLILSARLEDSIEKQLVVLAGSFLVVSAPMTWIYNVSFQQLDDYRRLKQIERLFRDQVDAILVNRSKFGLDRIEERVDFSNLFNSLEPGDTLYWLDTYAPAHKTWLPDMQAAVERGAHVRMLALKPESVAAKSRAQEIGQFFSEETFARELRSFIHDMRELANLNGARKGSLSIRLYEGLLGCPAYLVFRKKEPIFAISSVFLRKATGIAFPHFVWRQSEEPMLRHIAEYLEYRWEIAEANETAAAET